MEELKVRELEQINGGFIRAVAVGMIGSYAYEAVGGKAGIDNYFANGWASTKSSFHYWMRKLN